MYMDFDLDFSTDLPSAVLQSDLFVDPNFDTADIMDFVDSGNLDSPRNSNGMDSDSSGSGSRDYLSSHEGIGSNLSSSTENTSSRRRVKKEHDFDSNSSRSGSTDDGVNGVKLEKTRSGRDAKDLTEADLTVDNILENALSRALLWTEALKLFQDESMPYTNRPSGVPSGGLIYKEIKDKKRKQGEDRFINSGGVRGATDMPSGNGAEPRIRRRYGRVMREARNLPNLRYHDYRLLVKQNGVLKEQHDVIIYHTLPEALESPKPRDQPKKTVTKKERKKHSRKKVEQASLSMHVLSEENLRSRDTDQTERDRQDEQTSQFIQQIDWASLCTIQALPPKVPSEQYNKKKLTMK